MKALKIFQYVFAAVGLALLLGAAAMGMNTRSFLSSAVRTTGTVMALEPSHSDGSTTYRPVVSFETPNGPIEYRSSVSSNPPSYAVGDTVSVFYSPEKPSNAKIDGFFALWGAALILAIFGLVFFSIGGLMIVMGWRAAQLAIRLRREGTPVQARVQGVGLNESIRVNGRCPFRIEAQWQDPATSKLHMFYSSNLWFDPSDYVTQEHVTVFVERGNPKRYSMDTSFLPELAG